MGSAAGQYQPYTGRSSCSGSLCAAGKYGLAGATSASNASCTSCAAGESARWLSFLASAVRAAAGRATGRRHALREQVITSQTSRPLEFGSTMQGGARILRILILIATALSMFARLLLRARLLCLLSPKTSVDCHFLMNVSVLSASSWLAAMLPCCGEVTSRTLSSLSPAPSPGSAGAPSPV